MGRGLLYVGGGESSFHRVWSKKLVSGPKGKYLLLSVKSDLISSLVACLRSGARGGGRGLYAFVAEIESEVELNRLQEGCGGGSAPWACPTIFVESEKLLSCLMGDLVDEMNEKRSCSSSH
jgi:hypothetical protein